MIRRALTLGWLAMALAASPALAEDDKVAALEAKVAAMEQQIESLERKLNQVNAQMRQLQTRLRQVTQAEQKPDADAERQAAELLREIRQLAGQGKAEEAKAKLQELAKEHGGTRAARSARSVQQELALVGSEAPDSYHVQKWLIGEAQLPPDKPTLLVFWEVWCPHCRREAPKMQELHDKFKDKGLQVVGMTRITRSATEEKVMEFLQQQNISYPNAKVDYPVNQAFNVRGIPAAAVVKDGKVVWRGHPARLSEEAIAGWL
jgi:thiol-disulfide isomerase/thioredoxin